MKDIIRLIYTFILYLFTSSIIYIVMHLMVKLLGKTQDPFSLFQILAVIVFINISHVLINGITILAEIFKAM